MSFRDEVLWLAGLLEGEGCFGKNCAIYVKMKDKDVIEHVARIMGATVKGPYRSTTHPEWSEVWSAGMAGVRGAGWMMMLWPFMGRRRALRISESLAEWRSRPPSIKAGPGCRNPIHGRAGRRGPCPDCKVRGDRADAKKQYRARRYGRLAGAPLFAKEQA